jgi:hypothetical protein
MSQFYPYQLFQDMADAYVGSLPRLVFIQGHESEINKLNSNSSFPIMFLCEDVNLLTIRNIRQGLQEVRFRMYLLRQSPAQGQGLGKPQSNVQNDRISFTDYHGNMQDVADQMVSYLRFKRPDLSSQIQWETKPLKAQSTAFLTGVQVDCTLVMRDAYCQTDFVPAERAQPVRFLNRGGVYAGFVPIELESNFDAVIYYTTDGSIPTPQNGTIFDPDNIEFLTDTGQVRAIAFVDGLLPSVITSASYIIEAIIVFAQPQGGLFLQGQLAPIALGSNSQSTVIRFTLDGSEPNETSPIFTGAISINEITELKFIGFDPPAAPSQVVTEVYQIKALAPTVDTNSGVFITSRLVSAVNNNPQGQNEYRINSGAWVVGDSVLLTESANVAFRTTFEGYVTSDEVTRSIEIQCAAPTFVPANGALLPGEFLEMFTSTPDAEIRYTTDGSEPNETSTLYVTGLSITSTTLIKAIAIKAGTTNSTVSQLEVVPIQEVWYFYAGNNALKTKDRGNTWSSGTINNARPCTMALDGQFIYQIYGGNPSTLSKSSNYGDSFTTGIAQSVEGGGSIASGSMRVTQNNLMAFAKRTLANDLFILKTTDFVNWAQMPTGFTGVSTELGAVSEDGTHLAFTRSTINSSGVIVSNDGGQTWAQKIAFTGPRGYKVCMSFNGQYMYATLYTQNVGNWQLWKSSDFGDTWTQIAVGIQMGMISCDETGQYIYGQALTGGAFGDTATSGAWRSLDFGVTWEQMPIIDNSFGDIGCDRTGQFVLRSPLPPSPDQSRVYVSLNFGETFTEVGNLGRYVNNSITMGNR